MRTLAFDSRGTIIAMTTATIAGGILSSE